MESSINQNASARWAHLIRFRCYAVVAVHVMHISKHIKHKSFNLKYVLSHARIERIATSDWLYSFDIDYLFSRDVPISLSTTLI